MRDIHPWCHAADLDPADAKGKLWIVLHGAVIAAVPHDLPSAAPDETLGNAPTCAVVGFPMGAGVRH